MAIKDTAMNIVIKAKDLSKGVLKKFRGEVDKTGKAARATASGGLAKLAKAAGAAIAAFAGFSAIKGSLLAVLKTGDKFEKLGIQLETIMGSVEGGEQAFAWIKTFTKETPLQLDQTTEAFVKLKAFGLDPMDGSLQAILDQSEALGGGTEKLSGLILALGKSYSKGKIEAEEWNMLTERGVQVQKLFSDALGKTEEEVLAMRTAGKLGKEEIQKLLETMGEKYAGAAARQMTTLSGLVSNLTDSWEQFLVSISESGALDSVRGKLTQLTARIAELKANGDLDKFAQTISSAMVSLVGGLTAAGTAIVKFSDEILLLAKAFVAIKVAGAIKGIVSFSAALVTGTSTLRVYTGSMALATRALGKMQIAFLGLSSFLVGWEIGEHLRKEYKIVEQASVALVGGMLKGWEHMRHGWEATKAVFTDDTVEEAAKRSAIRMAVINESMAVLMDTAHGAKEAFVDLAGSTEGAIVDLDALVASSQAAITDTVLTAEEKIAKSLKALEVDIKTVENGISSVGAEAIAAFDTIVQAEQEAGREAEVASRSIRESFLAAFKDVETEAGQIELLKGLNKAFDQGLISAKDYSAAIEVTQKKVDAAALATSGWNARIREATESMKEAKVAGEEIGDGVEAGAAKGASAAQLVTGALEGYTAQMKELGEGAVDSFNQLAKGMEPAKDEAEVLRDRLDAVGVEIATIREEGLKLADTSGLQQVLKDLRSQARSVEQAFLEQKIAARGLYEAWDEGTVSAEAYIRQAERMVKNGELLDSQDLSNLQRGIDAAKRSMDSLNESTVRTLTNLQDELDRLQGNTQAIQERQYAQRISDLEELLVQAKSTGHQESIANAEESLRIAREIYKTEQANRKEAQQRQDKARRENESNNGSEQSRRDTGGSGSDTSNTQTVIRLEAGGQSASVSTDDPDALLDILEAAGLTTR